MVHVDRYVLEGEPIIPLVLRIIFRHPCVVLPSIITTGVIILISNSLNELMAVPLEVFVDSLGFSAMIVLASKILGVKLMEHREDVLGKILPIGLTYMLVGFIVAIIVGVLIAVELVLLAFLVVLVGLFVIIVLAILIPATLLVVFLLIAYPNIVIYEYFTDGNTFGEALRESLEIVKSNATSLSSIVFVYIILNFIAIALQWVIEKIPPSLDQRLLFSVILHMGFYPALNIPLAYILIAGGISLPILHLGSLLIYLKEKPYKLSPNP